MMIEKQNRPPLRQGIVTPATAEERLLMAPKSIPFAPQMGPNPNDFTNDFNPALLSQGFGGFASGGRVGYVEGKTLEPTLPTVDPSMMAAPPVDPSMIPPAPPVALAPTVAPSSPVPPPPPPVA